MAQKKGLHYYILCFSLISMSCSSNHVSHNSFRTGTQESEEQPSSDSGPKASANSAAANTAGIAPASQTRSGSDVSLPNYLFTLDEAKAIKTLVDPYRKPAYASKTLETAGEFETLRQFMEAFANKAMAIPELQPGRSFKIWVIKEDAPNASADGFQNLTVNTGTIKQSTADASLATFCHEMAHSTKNHLLSEDDRIRELGLEAKNAAVDAEISLYVKRQYNTDGTTYTHNLTEYQKVRKLWDESIAAKRELRKRSESEADIVGAMICASIGMNPTNFIAGYRSDAELLQRLFREQKKKSVTALQLKNDEKISFPIDHIYDFLFPFEGHPSDSERIQQLERTASAIQKKYNNQQKIFAEWQSQIKSFGGIALTDNPEELIEQQVITATSSLGREIIFVKPSGCRQGR